MVVELAAFTPPKHRFEFGQKVMADGDSPPMIATQVRYGINGEMWFCEWWYGGTLQSAVIEASRLRPA